jgi:hypothetical protein
VPDTNKNKDVIINQEPFQENLDVLEIFHTRANEITKVANFEITGRVLSKQKYNDKLSTLSKYDLLIGWGVMSDYEFLKGVKIIHTNRKVFVSKRYRYGEKIITNEEIITNYSNIHLFTDDKKNEKIIKNINENNIIYIKGYLINVKTDTNKIVKSSLLRTDTGAQACEVLWVEEIKIIS